MLIIIITIIIVTQEDELEAKGQGSQKRGSSHHKHSSKLDQNNALGQKPVVGHDSNFGSYHQPFGKK